MRIIDRLLGRGKVSTPSPSARRHEKPERRIVVEKAVGAYSAVGYKSAVVAMQENRSASSGSGDLHAQFQRTALLNQSRQFKRDNGIYSGMIDRAVSYIVGNGFTLQAKTADPEWNAAAETIWKTFWKDPEIRGLLDKHPHQIRIRSPRARDLARVFIDLPGVVGVRLDDGSVHVDTTDPDAVYDRLPRCVLHDGLPVDGVEAEDVSLDAIFDYLVS